MSAWACQAGLVVTPHVHHVLVLNLVGEALMNFSCTWELVQAMHDGLFAHEDAHNKCGILHWDISYLIDWDMVKSIEVQKAHHITCTGTWQFMLVCLIQDQSAVHMF
ncbi:hypothetical protein V8B97DRAFT_2022216 [Scleroderma yunnanense]